MNDPMNAPTRTWTNIGREWTAFEPHKTRFAEIFENLDWREVPQNEKMSLPFSQGHALRAAIEALEIPNVSHLAWNGSFSVPFIEGVQEGGVYAVYGVEGHYENARVRIYLLDAGVKVVPLASDAWDVVPEAVPEQHGAD